MWPTRKNEALQQRPDAFAYSLVASFAAIHSVAPVACGECRTADRPPPPRILPMPRRAVELPVLLPWLRRQSFSFPGRDAGQSPSSVVTPVSLLRLLPTSCRRSASSFPALVALLPTPRRRPASSACTPHRTAGQPRPPAPHSAPPVSCSQRHTAGQAPPPRALLSSSTHAHVAIEVIRGRERVHREGSATPPPLFSGLGYGGCWRRVLAC
jgi:hypothetical protein